MYQNFSGLLLVVAALFCLSVPTAWAQSLTTNDPLAPLEDLLSDIVEQDTSAQSGDKAGDDQLAVSLDGSMTIRALLEPEESAILSSEVDGKIKRVHRKSGERFRKGDPLISFECSSQEVERQRAQAALHSVRMVHENALQLQALNSIGDLDVSLAEAEVYISEAELAAAELQIERCVMHAPFSGRVIEVSRKQHEWINRGEPLMEIFDDNNFLLRMLIPSSWLAWLKVGYEFDVSIDETGRNYRAKVYEIGAKIDAVSRTVRVSGKVTDHDKDFLHSMSGNAHFVRP